MAYNIKLENNQLNIVEKFGRPIVYLDQWALKEIALVEKNRKVFINAMVNKCSILRISIQNMAELIKQSDINQRNKILSVIDSVDSGFINVDPKIVIDRENELIKNPTNNPNNPSLEIDLIEAYLQTKNLPPAFEISDIMIGHHRGGQSCHRKRKLMERGRSRKIGSMNLSAGWKLTYRMLLRMRKTNDECVACAEKDTLGQNFEGVSKCTVEYRSILLIEGSLPLPRGYHH